MTDDGGPLHLEDLLEMCCPCGSDSCSLTPKAACHPKAGVSVRFYKASGQLELRCRRCEQLVAVIAVAQRHSHAPALPSDNRSEPQ